MKINRIHEFDLDYKIDIDSSMKIVLETCRKYRLPEPTRLAHIEAGKYKATVVASLLRSNLMAARRS